MMQPEMILSAQVLALTQLQNLSLRLSTALALDDVLDVIIDAAGAICHADHIAISRLNAQSEMIILRQRGLSDAYLGARQLNRFDPTIERLVTTKAPYILENLEQLAGVSPNYEAWKQEGIGSLVMIPLLREGEFFGIIGAGSSIPRQYSKVETDAMAVLATQASAALVNAQLFEQLREANRAKDEFLSNLSHELRTPLTPILGWLHLLKPRVAKDALAAEGLETVERNAQQLAGLIEDLLDLTRIVSGKMELKRVAMDLAPLIDAVFAQQSAQAAERHIQMRLSLPEVPILSDVDSVRLQQVIGNLLSNAIKFTPKGGAISVSLRREAGRAVIEVSDTGIGIDAEFLPHIFERFAQAHGGINRRYGGLGLGLAIAQAIVETHDGEISAISSGVGQGTTFKVTLPLARRTGPLTVGASTALATDITPEHLGLRVLVVEDSPDTLTLMRVWLTAFGCEPITAADAAEGVRLAAEHKPDLIISDIGMPDVDGYELMRRIRQIAELANIPTIALTGYARREDREQALAAGYTAHLAKPAPMTELFQLIKELTR